MSIEFETVIDPAHPALPGHFPGERFRIVIETPAPNSVRFRLVRDGKVFAMGSAEIGA